jgi:hypothetical protein
MRLELFPKHLELLTVHPARTAWRFARCKLTPLPEPAQIPFYRRMTDPEGAGCFTNAEIAFPYGFDDSFT